MPASYLITDPSYYNTPEEFQRYLENIYQNHKIDYACFRDKKNQDILPFIKLFLEISKKHSIKKTFLNGNVNFASKFGFYGVHLQSTQFSQIKQAKDKGLHTLVSTHTLEDIQEVKDLCDGITFSPVFYSPNKSKPKGLKNLALAIKAISPKKCFALGGIITEKEIDLVAKIGAYGFASIRYFVVK